MRNLTSLIMTLCLATHALADGVYLGGLMNHLNVGVAAPVNGSFPLVITFDDDPGDGLLMVPGEPPLDPPYDVLEDRAYNAQYGWLRQGRWGPGPGEGVFIERIDSTPGLHIYEGAYGTDAGGGISGDLNGEHTLAPIFSTDDSPAYWQWDGRMTHHWHVTDEPGTYEATFSVYVAQDLNGTPGSLSELFIPGEITLTWIDNVSTPDYTADDIDAISLALRTDTTTPDMDYDNNGIVNNDDRTYLIQTLIGTLPADTNLDFTVDLLDLSNLAASFDDTNTSWTQGDANGDGTTNLLDLSLLATHFNTDAVPTPSTLALLLPLTLSATRRSAA
ncbi:hypothetical protein [Mucisphaera calidilacus]|uniref:Dockerin domain-containing protein n=1 Tax=Mucisphaera calidilacus TaxID=2527982 RepID=A0A518BYI6_9BACT|nr:hypothetical protein [Mucisphaera calidilacus]QDU72043.1 hypothetical protein Pan265_19030 [Mucisphaera calidilacus]